jgi:hypothetical protein
MQLYRVLVVHAHLHFQFRVIESQAEVLQVDCESQGILDLKGELTQSLILFNCNLCH